MQANPDDFRFGRSYLPAQAYEKRKEYIRKRTMLRRLSDPFSHADARNRNDKTVSVRYVPDPGAEDFAIGRHRNSDPFRTTRPGKRNARERESVRNLGAGRTSRPEADCQTVKPIMPCPTENTY